MVQNTLKIATVWIIKCVLVAIALSASPLQALGGKKLIALDRTVAVVNGEVITESELNKQTKLLLLRLQQTDTPVPPLDVLHKQLLERMILEKLQLQLATLDGIVIDEATLNEAMEDIARRDNIPLSKMREFLEQQGIPFAQFRDTIKTEMILSEVQKKEIRQNIMVSKAEIEQFLNSPAGQDESGTEFRLGHILISTPEEPSEVQLNKAQVEAEAIVKNLKSGGDFAKMAISKSAGQQALSGGDLGWRKLNDLPTLFAKAAPTLQIGEIYGPIRNSSGFHIIKLMNKRSVSSGSGKPMMRQKAMDVLYQRKFDEMLLSWLRRLRADSEVQIYLNEV